MNSKNLFSGFIFVIIIIIGLIWARSVYNASNPAESSIIFVIALIVALVISSSVMNMSFHGCTTLLKPAFHACNK